MVARSIIILSVLLCAYQAYSQSFGGLRGLVRDDDFDFLIPEVKIVILEEEKTTLTNEHGSYFFNDIKPGVYTVVFAKQGYSRQVKGDIVISEGSITELDISMFGEFAELDEFIVEDLILGEFGEAALLELRLESPAFMDSISADLMSQAGASDAAGALRLISGATVQDGKYAVVRGLPDRYVSSQMNGVRLPTADADKRAVQLDQFPSDIIDSMQVSKTFTPDQQGDASGGAVNIVLKGIPEKRILKLNVGTGWNTNDDFLSYKDGGLGFFGGDDRGSASSIKSGGQYSQDIGAAVTEQSTPIDRSWSVAFGDRKDFDDFTIGGLGSFFHDRSTSSYDDGIDDKYWFNKNKNSLEPQTSPDVTGKINPLSEDFTTSLYDVRQASEQVQWGGLGVFGIENEDHRLKLLYLYTKTVEDKATIAEDTRGKEYYFPGYDVSNPTGAGNGQSRFTAPYLRAETIEYTERTTQTIQLSGWHRLFDLDYDFRDILTFKSPELDWNLSVSDAELHQPDKRQFASKWFAPYDSAGFPPWIPPSSEPGGYEQHNSGSNINFGNYQRIWKDISEESNQYALNIKFPFEQWSGDEGYVKLGVFDDSVSREYEQESLSNSGRGVGGYVGGWNDSWSDVFADTNPGDMPVQPMTDTDVNYDGKQDISAWYYMLDVPVNSMLKFIGGARFEKTDLSIVNTPDSYKDVSWIGIDDKGRPVEVKMTPNNKGDVEFSQSDILPSIGFVFDATSSLTLRGSYSETVARQTFKELSPILQQEYLGGDIFIGNPGLQMASLRNYDLRLDWTPQQGSMFSVSYFKKSVQDPIEYVRRVAPTGGYAYTTAVNYPKGEIEGFEFEVRQSMDIFSPKLKGLKIGANATIIDSKVTLSDTDYNFLPDGFKFRNRDMVNTPEHLYNFFVTYDIEPTNTRLGLFYTIRGDSLLAGAGQSNGNFIPNIYETEYGTLNFSLSQKLSDIWKLSFSAKNLLNPEIETAYRYDGQDTTKSSYTKGLGFSISLSATF